MNLIRPLSGYRVIIEADIELPARQILWDPDFIHSTSIVHLDLHKSNIAYTINFTEADVTSLPEPEPCVITGLKVLHTHPLKAHFLRCLYDGLDREAWTLRVPHDPCFQIFDFGNVKSPL